MKEEFLHYVWKFQKYSTQKLFTVNGMPIVILSPGIQNYNAGPDFFNGRILIAKQEWAGNIEIHLKSSHWFAHSHETDSNYDSVILHVVWKHDMKVFRNDKSQIPTLVLENYVDGSTHKNYLRLFAGDKRWIHCEKYLPHVERLLIKNWLQRLYVERLEYKWGDIISQLETTQNHWELLFFRMLCKNFGLKVNGESFLSMATSIDFSVILKSRRKPLTLEALFYGQLGLLNEVKEDGYTIKLSKEYQYLKHKFKLSAVGVIRPKYFRLRPANFPTIRLSQLANLYASTSRLFSEVIKKKN